MRSEHVSGESLAYLEGRLAEAEAAWVEAHLAACAACRAEVEDLRYLADAVSAAPRALTGLDARRQGWAAVWGRVAARPGRAAPRSHGWVAWGVTLAVGLLVISSLLVSPYQNSALANSGPALAVIQTPSRPDTTFTAEPLAGAAVTALDTTATHPAGQTPAPIPNP
jgi:anti-sigma factor RsiW